MPKFLNFLNNGKRNDILRQNASESGLLAIGRAAAALNLLDKRCVCLYTAFC
jgi:hypothetical protein